MFKSDAHRVFSNQPDDAARIWRYIDLARYLSMLQTSAIHFSRADQMSDPWEGSFGPLNHAVRMERYGDEYERFFAEAKELRRARLMHIHLSSWHLSEFESAAMWEIYQREGRGVAIQSTWGALTGSLMSERLIYGGKVIYADYGRTLIPEGNTFDAFMHKRKSYAHEQEVRLLTLTGGGAPRPEPRVVPIPVDLGHLVSAVYVAPDAAQWLVSVVQHVTRQYGRDFPVMQSDLAQEPVA
jgi:hypothetical protein